MACLRSWAHVIGFLWNHCISHFKTATAIEQFVAKDQILNMYCNAFIYGNEPRVYKRPIELMSRDEMDIYGWAISKKTEYEMNLATLGGV